ncbi:hypothetical protein TRVL_09439 [Trypanosoma vivax]|nr:hypothetical protein TRVL_09439 [Trypanosoma vivax]
MRRINFGKISFCENSRLPNVLASPYFKRGTLRRRQACFLQETKQNHVRTELPLHGNPLRLGETSRAALGSAYLRTGIVLNVPVYKQQRPPLIQRSTPARAGKYSYNFIHLRVPVVLHTSSLGAIGLFPAPVLPDRAWCGLLASSRTECQTLTPR